MCHSFSSPVAIEPISAPVIAGDYPGGIVQVWDVDSGEVRTTIETGYGYCATAEFVFVSPDWSTLYVPHESRILERIEENGESVYAFHYDGGIRSWELSTGQERTYHQQSPPTGVFLLTPSPDGFTWLVSAHESSRLKRRMTSSLWDSRTGEFRPLGGGLYVYGAFDEEGRTVAVVRVDDESRKDAIQLFDVASPVQVHRATALVQRVDRLQRRHAGFGRREGDFHLREDAGGNQRLVGDQG